MVGPGEAAHAVIDARSRSVVPARIGVGSLVVTAALALACAAPAGARDDRLAHIQAAGVLRVCIWPDYYAITFRNPRNGALEGIDIDLSQALAQALSVRIDYVESTFATFMADLDADRCDVAMFGIGVTPARSERVAFSIPYLYSGIHAIAARSNRRIRTWDDIDRAGVVVAVQAGTFMEPALRSYLKQATLTVVQPPRTREEEVLSGRADVFATDFPYSRRMLFQHEWARVIEPKIPVAPTPYAYAVAKDQPQWLGRIDAFVTAIKRDGRLRQAARRQGLEPILAP
ncbi:MAG: amino acid ABC transporter substrate-binding protein [Alphaproteobacteria bacterium]|nr:amino acid ABC transporter substrate-binding protein [Alphaproteobacteria bacterium]